VSNPLSPDQIANLLKQDAQAPARKAGAKKDTTEPRIYDTWWKQQQVFGDCDNPDCADPRDKSRPGVTLVSKMPNGMMVCRYCFLDGVGRADNSTTEA
jgi:hypothetical protein